MKYLNFIKTEKGLIPTRHLNHIGYVYEPGLLYHDIVDHSINENGTMHKELLAQGAVCYRLEKDLLKRIFFQIAAKNYITNALTAFIESLFISNLCNFPLGKIYKTCSKFNTLLSYNEFLELIKDVEERYQRKICLPEFREKKLEYMYNTIAFGYVLRSRRKEYNIDNNKLSLHPLIKNMKYIPVGHKIKIPIQEIKK